MSRIIIKDFYSVQKGTKSFSYVVLFVIYINIWAILTTGSWNEMQPH